MRVLIALAVALLASVAHGQAPVTILVGYPAGGSTDTIARLIAEPLRKALDRPVVVENKPGASGLVAAAEMRRAPKDGSVLMVAPLVVSVLAPLTFRELPYDADRDLAPVTQLARIPQAFGVSASHPAKDVAQFVQWAKANPRSASFGSSTAGGLPHFLGLMLAREAGIDLTFIPYKGGAAMLAALAGDQIPAGADALPDLLALHRAGRIRILASAGKVRSPLAPDIPTFAEQGFPSLEAVTWLAVFAPGGTPKGIRENVARIVSAALRTEEMRDALASRAFEATGTTPDELAAIIVADRTRWAPVVKASGFRAD